MDIQESIQWTNDQVLKKTGKHLDSLQRTVLAGALEQKTYQQVAKDYHCSKDHAKRVASDLWKLLSDVLDEDVKKSNVKSILEHIEFRHISNWGSDSTQIFGNINICSDIYQNPEEVRDQSHSQADHELQLDRDLSEAPKPKFFRHRTEELATLEKWIVGEHHRLIAITGLSGMGKTTLARQLVEKIKDNFDRILWRSHRKYINSNALETDIAQFLFSAKSPQNSPIPNFIKTRNLIIDYLRSHRCLIILDDLQETLCPRKLVGHYCPGYDDYNQLIKEFGQSEHQSCVVLLGWEQPPELTILENKNNYCKTLNLEGLEHQYATEILEKHNLKDKQQWAKLIRLYSGNPLWLNLISTTILDLFNGSVSQFLSYSNLFLGDVESILKQHDLRLSETEKLVMVELAQNHGMADISNKPINNISDRDYLKALSSLRKRSLIEIHTEKSSSIVKIEPAILEYFKS